MIREASVYALKKVHPDELPSYGLRVLTTRKWLQGVRRSDVDLWLPDAGPSSDLLALWRRQGIAWEQFVECYIAEQRRCQTCVPRSLANTCVASKRYVNCSPVEYLARLASQQVVTVLCWEQGEQCHRHSLVRLIEDEMVVLTQRLREKEGERNG